MTLDLHTVLERAAFERYILADRGEAYLERTDPAVDAEHDYVNEHVQEAWEAWLARAALAQEATESADSADPSDPSEPPPAAARPLASASTDPYVALRLALSYATAPGSWIIGSPTSQVYVGLADSKRRLIEARAVGSHGAELTGFTELEYAVAAANAVPALLAERERMRNGLTQLRGFALMAGSTFREQREPMSSDEVCRQVMEQIDRLMRGSPSTRA